MREVLLIAWNDFSATLRERGTWVNIFVIPIFMTVLLGTVNSGSSSGGTLDILNLDTADPFAGRFISLLRAEAGDRFTICDLSTGGCDAPGSVAYAELRTYAETRVKEGRSAAALVIPPGFGGALTQNMGAPGATILDFIVQDGLNAPALIQQKIDAVLTRLNGSVAAARAVVAAVNPGTFGPGALYTGVLTAAEAIWASDPIRINDQTTTGTTAQGGTGFGQSAPGFGAMFVLINALGLASVFVVERQTWTLQRLAMMPVARWQILAGKLLGRYLLGLLVFTTLILVGTLFGARWGDLLGVVLNVLAYTLAATALALAFSTFVRTKSQAANLAVAVSLTLAPLGGAWWPLSITPTWMQTLGHLSPIAWSQDAFNRLVFYGGTVIDILPYLAVLLLFAALFFAVGLRRFRYV